MLLSSLFIIGQVAEAVTVDVGGSIRPRVEYVDDGGQGQGANVSKTHTTMQTRINVKATVDENVSAFIQIQDVRTWGGETPSTLPPSITRTGTSTSGQVDFHQAYLLVKDVMGTGLNLKVGRQEMVFDEARLIGNIGWIQQAQSFDAARIDTRRGDFGFTGFYAQTLANDTHPVLGSTLASTTVAESEFVGARGTYHLKGKDRITAYFYSANDPNMTVPGNAVIQKLHTAGLYAAATFNGVRFRVDTAYQFGEVTPTIDVEAYMMTFSIGKNLDIAEGARLEFWADYLSGDDGNDTLKRKQFTIPYGTNHKFYGHADKFLQNPATGLVDFVVKFNVKPTAKLKLQVHAHKFWAAETSATMTDTNLGSEIDLQLSYALAANTRLRMGYSRYIAGGVTNGGVGGNTTMDTNWAWAMMQTKF
jgi:hypothetical protein